MTSILKKKQKMKTFFRSLRHMQNSNCEEVQKKVIVFGCRLEKPWRRAATHTITRGVCACLGWRWRSVMSSQNDIRMKTAIFFSLAPQAEPGGVMPGWGEVIEAEFPTDH